MGKRRLAGATLDGDPNLEWELRANPVEAESREKADHTPGHRSRHDDQAGVLGHGPVGQLVLASGDALQDAVTYQPGELLAVDASAGGLPGRDHTPAMGEIQELIAILSRHV
jgi:hypothetical protein